jgi:hypothetical protein
MGATTVTGVGYRPTSGSSSSPSPQSGMGAFHDYVDEAIDKVYDKLDERLKKMEQRLSDLESVVRDLEWFVTYKGDEIRDQYRQTPPS